MYKRMIMRRLAHSLFLCTTTSLLLSNAFTAFSNQSRVVVSQSLIWASKSTNAANDVRAPATVMGKAIRKTQLKTDLKQYRQQQANKKPLYTVFTNAVLEEIYACLPTTHEELLQVKGIGPKKLELFGDDILRIVAPYTDASGNLPTLPVESNLPVTSSSSASPPPPSLAIPRPSRITAKSLTNEQKKAADFLLQPSHPNGFITGSAGTGKSYVLKYLCQEFQHRQKRRVGVCAPTGVAAIHVGGSTVHSFFGIGLGQGSVSSLVQKVLKNQEAVRRIDETDVLIIDECSMLSSDLLETLDAVVRQIRRSGTFADLPMGGMQVICFGDFFQLPPIVKGDYGNDNKPFCFESEVWEELGLMENMVELKEVKRQDDKSEFVQLLNKIRVGDVDARDIQQLNERCVISEKHPLPTDGIVPTKLYSLNRDVDGENEARLDELQGKEVITRARNAWKEPMPLGTLAVVKQMMAESLRQEMPDEVRLKVGAQVMLTRNRDLEKSLVNGSRGVVIHFQESKEGEMVPIVRFDCGVITTINPVEAVRYNPDGGPGCLARTQLPLKLAWAVTVHKSQGTTLTRAMLDISSAFEFGQCYVALSRVCSLDGLWLVKPARLSNIKVSKQVLDFYYKRQLEP